MRANRSKKITSLRGQRRTNGSVVTAVPGENVLIHLGKAVVKNRTPNGTSEEKFAVLQHKKLHPSRKRLNYHGGDGGG